MSAQTMLVCSVGGTAEAVAAAVKGCAPDRIVFIVSPETRSDVDGKILPLLSQENIQIGAGQYDVAPVNDAQDLAGCVERIREVGTRVHEWAARGADFQVIVDITGGTKCMSAALALAARTWPCRFSYVGGESRSKDGKGVVVSGREKLLYTQNPWNALGYQAAEESVVLFDMGDYQGALQVLWEGLWRVERGDLKAEIVSLRLLAEAYLAWDLFKHKECDQKLKEAQKHANNLRHVLPATAEGVLGTVKSNRTFLAQLDDARPARHFVLDLCANARRCAERGRYDDAVARLYRAVEATAQVTLRDSHGIEDTGHLAPALLPEPLRTQWSGRARDGVLQLGLADDYRLLATLGDALGGRFISSGLMGTEGALASRNQSVLAHGWTPVGKGVFEALWKRTLDLAGIAPDELPRFPKLGVRRL